MAGTGYVKPIVIGVVTTLLGTVIISQFGLNKGDSGSTDRDGLLQRQAELEAKIQQLSGEDLEKRKADLNKTIQKMEETNRPRQYAATDEMFDESVSVPYIGGMWYDVNTGAPYKIAQDGDYLTIEEYSMGIVSATGNGTISGQSATFSYNTLFNTQGRGKIHIPTGANQLNMTFTDLTTGVTLTSVLSRSQF